MKDTEELAKWNDEMVSKYHKDGTLFESKNFILRALEKMRLKKLLQMSKIKPEDSFLDLGCGEGFLLSMTPKAQKIQGVDISKVALEKAKVVLKDRPEISVEFGNAQELHLEDASFNKVISSEMLEHVPEPRKVIDQVHRILKPSGLFVVSVPDERRIQFIMKVIKFLRLDKILHAARKQADYEWHLHEADVEFMKKITEGKFKILKVARTPPLFGYRLAVKMVKV